MYHFAIGTYNKSNAPSDHLSDRGISLISFDSVARELNYCGEVFSVDNPSYLTWNDDDRIIYAVSEKDEYSNDCAVYLNKSFEEEKIIKAPALSRKNCFIAYFDGRVYSLSYIDGELTIYDKHCSSYEKVVIGGKLHCCTSFFNGIYITDIERDIIWKYDDSVSVFLRMEKGSGPRHLISDGNYLYILCENTPYLYSVNKNGEIISKVRTSSETHLFPSAIRILPNKNILIVSNRVADTISFFSINNGKLEFMGEYPGGGMWPRDFIITRDEKYLIVFNQNSDNIVVFPLDWNNKKILGNSISSIRITTPVCGVELY